MAKTMVKLVDGSKCDGCRACMVACKNWNDLSAEIEEFSGYSAHKSLSANTWNNIRYEEVDNPARNEGLNWALIHESCQHCVDAGCKKACPESAISHTKFGSVLIDHDKCVGCGYCVENCIFRVPHIGTISDGKGNKRSVSKKCTLCIDRIEIGLEPACVTSCHTGSLQFGERDEMIKIAKKRLEAIKERYPNANIYDTSGIDGSTMIYLLTEKPEVYGLPNKPKLPIAQTLWKDYAQPYGKLLFGATTMAVVGGIISNQIFNKPKDNGEKIKGVNDHD